MCRGAQTQVGLTPPIASGSFAGLCDHPTALGCYVRGEEVYWTAYLWHPDFLASSGFAHCDEPLKMQVFESPVCP